MQYILRKKLRYAIDNGAAPRYDIENCTVQQYGGETMANTEKILNRIRELRMTQKDIADRLGIKQSTLSLKINNKRPFYIDEALRMAKMLQISDDEFGSYFCAKEVA